ncbi:hypothetical protein Q3G72_004772 [Acer saccharum]|nr:hypothetical protein Q3G72_004772 [Acer saccharum]
MPLSVQNQFPPQQPLRQGKSLNEVMESFVQETRQSIKNLEKRIGHIASSLSQRDQGRLPSQAVIKDEQKGRSGTQRRRRRRRRKMGDLYAWLVSFFVLIALLVLVVYQLMCLADLEFDYINPYDSSSRINKVILPEFIAEGVLCFFYLITGHWFMSLLCVPYLYYNVRLYMRKQHLVDVTEIFNLLNWEKKQRLFKLAYLVFLLFLSIFWMIWCALEDSENDI